MMGMSNDKLTIGLLSDFNIQNLAVLLQKHSGPLSLNCKQAPYGHTTSVLLNGKDDFWSAPYDALIIWTLPDRVIPSFNRVASFEEYSIDALLTEVDSFAAQIREIPKAIRAIFFPSWIAPGVDRGLGPLDLANNVGVANAIIRMNLRLADDFERDRRVIMLDTQRWVSAAGAEAWNPKLWYMSKTPFDSSVFQEACKDILAAMDGIQGRSKKVVVLDLDDTLWGGIVGDVGWERLRLGGHDPVGEAFVDFQRNLKRLVNRGILLAIVSKNEETVALEAIRRHPEMVLKPEDFAGWKINWQDKAANIVELLASLNLGLDSVVFLDDSPFERARVRETLPQVLVPELPVDPMQYASFLRNLRCFDNPIISKEDRTRTSMYVADRQRVNLKTEVKSLGEWLKMLELSVIVEPLRDGNLERAAQLFNKTNQMNLSTRRLTSSELLVWANAERHNFWTFRISDKFGDYGLCGISSLVLEGSKGKLLDFVLSCRVMGRGVEESIVSTVANHAKSLGCQELYAEFIPTPKNQPCERWLESLPNFAREGNIFRLSPLHSIDFPPHVRITMA
jgi:FkbH-like protein